MAGEAGKIKLLLHFCNRRFVALHDRQLQGQGVARHFWWGAVMGKIYSEITADHRQLMLMQKLFFVATAAPGCRINLSPKGMDTLHIMSANRILWMNLTGSGNETAAHLAEEDRMTVMFCSFDENPKILRLYGHATIVYPGDEQWSSFVDHFPAHAGQRQIIDMRVDLVHSSCGFGVPLYEFQGERSMLKQWATKKGPDGIRQYWKDRNRLSLDGKPIDIPDE